MNEYDTEDLPDEEWRDIEGFEGHYAVSNMGRVKSLDRKLPHQRYGQWHIRERILRQALGKRNQYLTVMLHVGNGVMECYRVHILVAEAFIPKVEGKRFINHKDGNKKNNRVDNLEWCTAKENSEHAWRTGLCERVITSHARAVINLDTGEIFRSIAEAERNYHVSYGLIQHAAAGKRPTGAGYHWQYLDEYKKVNQNESKAKTTPRRYRNTGH